VKQKLAPGRELELNILPLRRDGNIWSRASKILTSPECPHRSCGPGLPLMRLKEQFRVCREACRWHGRQSGSRAYLETRIAHIEWKGCGDSSRAEGSGESIDRFTTTGAWPSRTTTASHTSVALALIS
jgi:hypothetical protein